MLEKMRQTYGRALHDEMIIDPDFREASSGSYKPLKIIYYSLQIFMMIVGFSLAYYSINLRWTSRDLVEHDHLFTALLDAGIVIGVLTTIFACFGIATVGARSKKMGSAYILIVFLLIFACIAGIWWVQNQIKLLSPEMSSIWDSLSQDSKRTLQDLGGCCGFDSPFDRALRPCPRTTVGCFPVDDKSPVMEWFRTALLMALSIVFSLGFANCVLCIFLVFVHANKPKIEMRKCSPQA